MSKKISQLTLKNSLASTDVFTILDSADNYANKKVLASSISGGGGSSTLAGLTDVTLGTLQGGDVLTYDAVNQYWYNAALSIDWSNVSNKPTFATVATSGDYGDLLNTPTIPSALGDLSNVTISSPSDGQVLKYDGVNQVWINGSAGSSTVAWSDVTGKPNFATVATSGDYGDLLNTPTIPTVNDATLTIEKNGTSVGTFTANASSNAIINITETVQSASAPLSITSNALSISQSDTSTNGYLSSTDWNTFNGKVSPQTVVSSGKLSETIANVDANTRYVYTSNLMSLTISAFTDSVLESEIQFTTDLSFTFTDNSGLTWMLIDAPTFEPLTEYVIAIKNGYAVLGKVGA